MHHDDGEGATESMRRLVPMRWYAKLLDDMITRLEGIPEGTGSVMDNTLIVWIGSLRYSSHGTSNLPVVLAGDLGGALRTGRYLDTRTMAAAARSETSGPPWAISCSCQT